MSLHIFLGTLAVNASLFEVFTAPKPGLVDRWGSGAHDDMDFATFLLSAAALAPFWPLQALKGLQGVHPDRALKVLRKTGIEMDRAMFEATSGVNTHKGLIFALSLLLYGAGRCIFLGIPPSPSNISNEASLAVSGCCERELGSLRGASNDRPLSSGERIYLEHGLTGIRGEAEGGFPTVIRYGIPSFRKGLSMRATRHDSALFALFNLMIHGQDTNKVARKGFTFWTTIYRSMVSDLLRHDLPYSPGSIKALKESDRIFSLNRVSPGGAADLLTCTLFLHDCESHLADIVSI
jgi:triphosphoribosyl-dephospho-CoA synthetase